MSWRNGGGRGFGRWGSTGAPARTGFPPQGWDSLPGVSTPGINPTTPLAASSPSQSAIDNDLMSSSASTEAAQTTGSSEGSEDSDESPTFTSNNNPAHSPSGLPGSTNIGDQNPGNTDGPSHISLATLLGVAVGVLVLATILILLAILHRRRRKRRRRTTRFAETSTVQSGAITPFISIDFSRFSASTTPKRVDIDNDTRPIVRESLVPTLVGADVSEEAESSNGIVERSRFDHRPVPLPLDPFVTLAEHDLGGDRPVSVGTDSPIFGYPPSLPERDLGGDRTVSVGTESLTFVPPASLPQRDLGGDRAVSIGTESLSFEPLGSRPQSRSGVSPQ